MSESTLPPTVRTTDPVPGATAAFEAKGVWCFAPGDPIPEEFAEVLRGWRHCPAWVKLPPPKPRLIGWSPTGEPIYLREERHDDRSE